MKPTFSTASRDISGKVTDHPEPGRRPRRRVCYVTDFYKEEVLTGVADYARQAGWELNANMRFHGCFPPPRVEFDGILATVTGSTGPRVHEWLRSRDGLPTVRMISTRLDGVAYPAVEVDYEAAGRAGARHLLELGQIHAAFYTIHHAPDIEESRRGFYEELRHAGRTAYRIDLMAENPEVRLLEASFEERCRLLAIQLSKLPRPLAIMTNDDRRSLEVIEASRLCGDRVPEDVAVLGCDNCRITQQLSSVSLSSVNVNFHAVGWESAALLDRLMDGDAAPAEVLKVSPAGVAARGSTATYATDCPEITEAVLHLREHFRERVQLSDLARRAGMSESTFRQKFKHYVGRTAREELLHAKVSHAKQLLRDTDLKLEGVAAESGFSSAGHLCGVFAEICHCTPNDWRRESKNLMLHPSH